ncbi:MAG: PD-(D/E)XK nuclease family protein, partial [Ruminiclostridium sp.]|nr:PD-(D/E)XK nuclease family protein [Ruminiclostridium sp.]
DILTLTEFGLLRQKFLAENKDGKKSTKRHKKVFMNDAYNLRCAAESYDIGPKDWEKGFENDPRQELARLEKLREGIIAPLLELRNSLENADDGAELSRKFMIWLLNKQDMLSSLKGMSTRNDGDKDHLWRVDKELLEEAKRIWNAVCEVFTSMAYCLDGKKIGIEDYRLLLEGILSEINLANPPQVLDCVTVGDIERTRKSSPKTVIIAGFSDKNIPRSPSLESIFTDSEREKLNVSGLSIYDKKLDRCSKEYYFVKRAMELYEKDLILTYSYQDVNGHETERSGILSSDEYKSLEEKSELGDDFFINTAYDLRSAVSRYYNEDREKAEKLDKILQELNNSSEYSEKVSDALTLLNGGRRFSLDKGTACALLGGKKYSPTSLESMFECPFMYFGKYGLGLSENNSKDIAAANNKGTVIHSILHSVLIQYPGSDLADKLQYDPDTGIMNNDEIKKIAAEAVKREAFNNIANDPTFPERTKALFNAMLPSITNILTQMALELRMGKYRPAELEKKVRYNIYDNDLPESENGHITIEGFADRIDLYTEGEKEYVRIFDYKSGRKIKTFSIDDVEYGANLQMLLYLFAECRKNEEAQDENTSSDENASEKKQRLPGEIGYFSTGTAKIYRADGSAVGSQKAINAEWYDSHPINGA